jgi:hypothetical protein
VVKLPVALMAQARLLREHAAVKAAVMAQLAVAIGILTFAPVRLSNLVHIRLDQNLIKPGGLNAPYMLVFADYDVKNRVKLEFLFDDMNISTRSGRHCCGGRMTSGCSPARAVAARTPRP